MMGSVQRRLQCLLFGHEWVTLRTHVSKSLALSHLHPMAGLDCDCTRCGAEWRDADLMAEIDSSLDSPSGNARAVPPVHGQGSGRHVAPSGAEVSGHLDTTKDGATPERCPDE